MHGQNHFKLYFSLKKGYIGSLKFGCYYLQYVPVSKPFDHVWFEVLSISHNNVLYLIRYPATSSFVEFSTKFTRRAKPNRIIGDLDHQRPDKWSSAVHLPLVADQLWRLRGLTTDDGREEKKRKEQERERERERQREREFCVVGGGENMQKKCSYVVKQFRNARMFIDWNVSGGIISRALPTMPQPHAGPRSPLPRPLQPLTNNFRSTTINSIPQATQGKQKCEVLRCQKQN